MVKRFLLLAGLTALSSTAMAGGFLTNSNQSISFLRMPAQEGVISIEGAYYNPAGIGFLNNGWHMAINWQSAYQKRDATSTFGGFALGAHNNGTTTKVFEGTASAPIIPSFDLGFVKNRWFGSFHFGLTGGGGKATYKHGLGSFESIISAVPLVMNNFSSLTGLSITNYDFDSYMHGRYYHFGAQLGVGYRVTDNFSVSVGGRMVYATASYEGYVKNIQFGVSGTPNAALMSPMAKALIDQYLPIAQQYMQKGISVDATQKGWGFTPIIGIDWRVNDQWNIGARYEFNTRLRLKNKSNVTAGTIESRLSALNKFHDGEKIASDIPAIAALGVQYSPTKRVRVALAGHMYFDKQATQYNDEQKHLAGNSWELLAGVEYDFADRWTASIGGQRTDYGLGKNSKYLTDMSFTTDSYSLGFGVKFKVSDKVSINAAYFKTFYKAYERTATDYNNIGTLLGNMSSTLLQNATARLTEGMTAAQIAALQASPLMQTAQQIPTAINQMKQAGAFKGMDSFDRTNDVFGLGVDIRF